MATSAPRSPVSHAPRWLTGGAALSLVLGGPGYALAQSCAMCASSFGPDDPIQRAFSWSILFLMATPYTIVGTVAGWLFLTYRRAPGRHRASVIDLGRVRRPTAAEATGGDVP